MDAMVEKGGGHLMLCILFLGGTQSVPKLLVAAAGECVRGKKKPFSVNG